MRGFFAGSIPGLVMSAPAGSVLGLVIFVRLLYFVGSFIALASFVHLVLRVGSALG